MISAFVVKWLVLAGMQTAATMSPGPAFVMCVRNAMTYDRRAGVFTALGLGAGVGAHVLFVLFGISFLIARSVFLYSVIKYLGAAYLVYVGLKAIRAQKYSAAEDVAREDALLHEMPAQKNISDLSAFVMGFMTNLLNPKAVLFFTAVYAQFIDLSTPWEVNAFYGATSVFIEVIWFMGVATVLTDLRVKQKFMERIHWVDRCCGGLMIGLGVKLALLK